MIQLFTVFMSEYVSQDFYMVNAQMFNKIK